jgi:hypothetical protein
MSDVTRFIQFWRENPKQRPRMRKVLNRFYEKAGAKDVMWDGPPPSSKRRSKRGRPKGPSKPRVVQMGDRDVTMVNLSDAANRVGVSRRTFWNYDEHGVIPENKLVDEKGRRWYPLEFIEFLVPLLEDQGTKREPRWSVKRRVEQAWQEACSRIPKVEEVADAGESSGGEHTGTDNNSRDQNDT